MVTWELMPRAYLLTSITHASSGCTIVTTLLLPISRFVPLNVISVPPDFGPMLGVKLSKLTSYRTKLNYHYYSEPI